LRSHAVFGVSLRSDAGVRDELAQRRVLGMNFRNYAGFGMNLRSYASWG
jgi:hypothetical protein